MVRFHGFLAALVCAFFLTAGGANASPRYADGQIIVRFEKPLSLGAARKKLSPLGYRVLKPLIPDLGLYLVGLGQKKTVDRAVSHLNGVNGVRYAQPDHFVRLRDRVPNDPEFTKQWSLLNAAHKGADIGVTKAWDFGTGGKDRDGNDIVIALVDGGMDIKHKDLQPNVWVNPGEIPNNQIDDEGNGFIDDVNGWSADSQSGDIPAAKHGTHVAGIMGASGNNGTLISGINWNVKIMPVVIDPEGTTSVVAAAYGYVIKQKKLWIESKGKKGANIVVSNSSFGIDGADCSASEYTVWNDLYNEMGAVGILSAVATANNDIDVDKEGDVPSGCMSEFLVKVTNTDQSDDRNEYAAYGKKSIDLGAPGTDIWSTLPDGETGSLTGTSMATPHVAGAIALLYSLTGKTFQDEVRTNVVGAARKIKALVLDTVQPISALQDKTVSGGRLNLARAAEAAAQMK